MIRTLIPDKRFQDLWELRHRISTQIYIAVVLAVGIIMFASFLGIGFVNQIGEAQRRVNEQNVPRMVAAFEVAVQTEALTAVAPRLAAARSGDLSQISREVAEVLAKFQIGMAEFSQIYEGTIDLSDLRASEAAIVENIGRAEELVRERNQIRARSEKLQLEFQLIRGELAHYLGAATDNQLFFLKTGYRELGKAPASRARHFNEAEFERFRLLAELSRLAEELIQQIASGFVVTDEALLSPLEEEFESSLGRAQRVVDLVGVETRELDEIIGELDRLVSLGIAEDSGFKLRARTLRIDRDIQGLLTNNRLEGTKLVTGVKALVASASEASSDATRFAANTVRTAKWTLAVLTFVSIVGALVMAWLFVERRLVRRLLSLSQSMRDMALGDLDVAVGVEGRDEIAEMANALEVFRQHAREHLRLNVVEEMANQLQLKNEALESTMTQLHKAQDQVIMQQKLAALGELTAGVAHEIKNPMNFILNFAEVSEELVEEMLEEIKRLDPEAVREEADTEEVDFDLINSIADDLTSNMSKIREHSQRANSVVVGMLAMGRGSGEATPTDINELLDESARLAFHSARAADNSFMADVQQDLDPTVGKLTIKSQDLGRAFINVIGNACMAVDEKRVRVEELGGDRTTYQPTLIVRSKREGDAVKVTIWDNGVGMTSEVKQKIFNPFFTTKPTNRGTGLGLSMTMDTIREHGGAIHVDSVKDDYTAMEIELRDYVSNNSQTGGSNDGPEPDPGDKSGNSHPEEPLASPNG